jgi:uncharacterized protein (DUF58 family)
MHAPDGLRAALPRRVPRGVRLELDELLNLRRYGAAMRSALALDDEPREGRRPSARSHGMDYAESRPYSPDDDVRRIDWRITARTGRAHTKIFRLERCNDLYCLVDQRAPMGFGTRAALKSVVAAEIAALAGWAAAAGGDRFGALIAGGLGATIPTGAAEGAAAALCTALARSRVRDEPYAGETPLDALAARAVEEAPSGARLLVVSGLTDRDEVLERAVKVLRARGALVLVWVLDPMDERLPLPGRYPLTDGREHVVLDTAAAGVRAAHARDFAARREWLQRCAALPGTRCHWVRTGEDLFDALGHPLAFKGSA